MTKKVNEKYDLPSKLEYARRIECANGLIYAGKWSNINDGVECFEKWDKVKIHVRKIRGTQSSHGTKNYDMTQANPKTSNGDDANLPNDKDTMMLKFNVKIIGHVGSNGSSSRSDFFSELNTKISEFKRNGGLSELAYRYAYNIANGRFLWRNRTSAIDVKIVVKLSNREILEFDSYDFSLNNFEKGKDDANLKKLSSVILKGLLNDSEYAVEFFDVYGFALLGNGQHVFPSEEMIMGSDKKVLYNNDDCAAMHDVKLCNAIRTIDTWYGDKILTVKGDKKATPNKITDEQKTPIAVDPFGAVTQKSIAYRPNNNDLYTLIVAWVNNEDISNDDKLFITASIIRGGVFGKKKDKK